MLSGCKSGGLRNVVSWMRPGNYSALEESKSSDALVASSDSSAGQARPSIRERVTQSLPWNKSVDPDPFLTADTGVKQDDPRLDVSVPEQDFSQLTRTVSATKDAGPLPTIQPEKPASRVSAQTESADPFVPDSEADMQAIERMIANLDPPKRSPSEATPLFRDSDPRSDAAAEMDSILAAALEQPSESAGNAIRKQLDKAQDAEKSFERHLAAAVANHDRHAVTGPGADQALERAISPNEFDQVLDLDRLAGSGDSPVTTSNGAPPMIRPSAKEGVSVASVAEAFPAARIPAMPEPQAPVEMASEPDESSQLVDAVDAFDRTLARAEKTSSPTAAFDWNLPAGGNQPLPGNTTKSDADRRTPFEQDPFGFADAGQSQPEQTSGQIDFSDFRSQQMTVEPAVSPQALVDGSPFQFAGNTRTIEPDVSPSPIIRIPGANPPWDAPADLSSDPVFESGNDALTESAVVPPVPEVTAETDAPEIAMDTRSGMGFRNLLLLVGGMIVVILLFAPARKRG